MAPVLGALFYAKSEIILFRLGYKGMLAYVENFTKIKFLPFPRPKNMLKTRTQKSILFRYMI
jgi:hypothetical protein